MDRTRRGVVRQIASRARAPCQLDRQMTVNWGRGPSVKFVNMSNSVHTRGPLSPVKSLGLELSPHFHLPTATHRSLRLPIPRCPSRRVHTSGRRARPFDAEPAPPHLPPPEPPEPEPDAPSPPLVRLHPHARPLCQIPSTARQISSPPRALCQNRQIRQIRQTPVKFWVTLGPLPPPQLRA